MSFSAVRGRKTYISARTIAIFLRTSESERDVSSNPGVSINSTRRPPASKGGESVTSRVHERNSFPTGKSEFASKFMNYLNISYSEGIAVNSMISLTDDFPDPVAPITLVRRHVHIPI